MKIQECNILLLPYHQFFRQTILGLVVQHLMKRFHNTLIPYHQSSHQTSLLRVQNPMKDTHNHNSLIPYHQSSQQTSLPRVQNPMKDPHNNSIIPHPQSLPQTSQQTVQVLLQNYQTHLPMNQYIYTSLLQPACLNLKIFISAKLNIIFNVLVIMHALLSQFNLNITISFKLHSRS